MRSTRARSRTSRAVALCCAVLAGLVALTGCVTRPNPGPDIKTPEQARRGGTVTLLDNRTVSTWDPQSLSDPADATLASRLFVRTLTTYAVGAFEGGTGPQSGAGPLVGDLSVGPGTTPDGGLTWTFLLRNGALWQDGKEVSCEDVRYGVSRSFDAKRAGGTRYAVELLDVPRHGSGPLAGQPMYAGPTDTANQRGFDAAIVCTDRIVTFRLRQAVADFPDLLTLPEFAPYRRDIDERTDDRYTVFSDGPYILEGLWHPGQGGKLTRNYNWGPLVDTVRDQNVEAFRYVESVPDAEILARLSTPQGEDRFALALRGVPTAARASVEANAGLVRLRALAPAGTVEYLRVRARSAALADPLVRRALALATDRAAYAGAGGGAVEPTTGLIPWGVDGRAPTNPLGAPPGGDVTGAAALLREATVTLPVSVRLAVPEGAGVEDGVAALVTTWRSAGFDVVVVPVSPAECLRLLDPKSTGDIDVVLASTRLAWLSGEAVVPAALGLGLATTPADGAVEPDLVAAVERARSVRDRADREVAWSEVDELAVGRAVVIPLGARTRLLLRGPLVQRYAVSTLSGAADLGLVAVRPLSDIP